MRPKAGTSSAGQHEMRSVGDMRRQSRYSTLSSRPDCTSGTYISYGMWSSFGAALLLMITLTFIVACGYFTVTMLQNSNINGAVWAMITGAVSCGMLTLFVLFLARRLEHWHDKRTMNGLKIFSMTVAVGAGLSFGIYLVLGFVRKQGFSMVGENYFSAAVFSGFCLGCNLLLYFTAQWFQNILPVEDSTYRFHLDRLHPSTNA